MTKETYQDREIDIGYRCACGFTTTGQFEFKGHILIMSRKEGKGSHFSLGKVDMRTGAPLALPDRYQTPEERSRFRLSQRSERQGKAKSSPVVSKKNIGNISYEPKIESTAIMRNGLKIAIKEWGWRSNMPLTNFIDTVIYHFFIDRGIKLRVAVKIQRAEYEKESRWEWGWWPERG